MRLLAAAVLIVLASLSVAAPADAAPRDTARAPMHDGN